LKLKIRTNYGQPVIDCFVSIVRDCDVTVLGPWPAWLDQSASSTV